jgi:hypothetical protein
VRQRDDLNRMFQRSDERSGFGRKRGGHLSLCGSLIYAQICAFCVDFRELLQSKTL